MDNVLCNNKNIEIAIWQGSEKNIDKMQKLNNVTILHLKKTPDWIIWFKSTCKEKCH